ncbi:hypothetical protein [Enterococcus sp. AZ126]|uniref:hypothetical protein n=1 Tax=Enterococcus sp. AZ126 TaxID=2774635 RepID=UPI003F20C59D
MNKKKAVKLGIITGIIVLLGIVGVLGVKKMTEPTEKEKQIDFLKVNKRYIEKKAFEINGKMTVENIHFDWDTVTVEYSGVIKSIPYALSVEVSSTMLSNGKKYNDILVVKTDVDKLDTITSVAFR